VSIGNAVSHSHPLVRAGVLIAAAVLVVLLVMTALSAVVGLLWSLVKVALFVLLVAGLVHMWHRSRAASRR